MCAPCLLMERSGLAPPPRAALKWRPRAAGAELAAATPLRRGSLSRAVSPFPSSTPSISSCRRDRSSRRCASPCLHAFFSNATSPQVVSLITNLSLSHSLSLQAIEQHPPTNVAPSFRKKRRGQGGRNSPPARNCRVLVPAILVFSRELVLLAQTKRNIRR